MARSLAAPAPRSPARSLCTWRSMMCCRRCCLCRADALHPALHPWPCPIMTYQALGSSSGPHKEAVPTRIPPIQTVEIMLIDMLCQARKKPFPLITLTGTLLNGQSSGSAGQSCTDAHAPHSTSMNMQETTNAHFYTLCSKRRAMILSINNPDSESNNKHFIIKTASSYCHLAIIPTTTNLLDHTTIQKSSKGKPQALRFQTALHSAPTDAGCTGEVSQGLEDTYCYIRGYTDPWTTGSRHEHGTAEELYLARYLSALSLKRRTFKAKAATSSICNKAEALCVCCRAQGGIVTVTIDCLLPGCPPAHGSKTGVVPTCPLE